MGAHPLGIPGSVAPAPYDRSVITLPRMAPGAPVTVSATQYVTYRTCPDEARLRFTGVYAPDSRQSLRGMLAHRMFYRHLTGGALELRDVEGACLEEIGERYNGRLSALGLTKMSTLRPLIQEVTDLYARFAAVEMDGFRRAEIDIVHDAGGEVTLRGTVDAVFDGDGGVRLVDWKTGSLGEAQHQLDFYALLWTIDSGEIPTTVEASSVSSGDRYVASPTLEGLQEVGEIVTDIVGELRRFERTGEALERTAGPHCRWCPAVNECPEGRTAVSLAG